MACAVYVEIPFSISTMSSIKRQYLLIDHKKFRRNSAPESLPVTVNSPNAKTTLRKATASVSDFSVLLEAENSGSSSSLELDTSNYSREMTPVPCSPCLGSYQNLPQVINFEIYRRNSEHVSVWYAFCSRSIIKTVAVIQVMSMCLTVMQLANEYLRDLPYKFFSMGQNFPCYIFLSLVWTTQLAWKNDGRGIFAVMKLSGLRYVLLAALHVQANYLLLSSFQHSSYLGNQVIDGVAASLSLLLAYVCLEVHIHLPHIIGFVFATLGAIGLNIAHITHSKGASEVSWGDILRIASGLFLAFNTLAQELIVKSIDSVEYLGMVGLAGSFICGFQAILSESNHVLPTSAGCFLGLASFSAGQFVFSCLAPRALRETGTIGMHLGLITASFYTHIVNTCLGKEEIDTLIVCSFGVVLVGSYIFTVRRMSVTKHYFFPVKVVISKGN